MENGFSPITISRLRLARMSVATIIYQARISKVDKRALDVLAHLICELIEGLIRHANAFAHSSSTTAVYEDPYGQFTSTRRQGDFLHESKAIIDMALNCLSAPPTTSSIMLGLESNTWNPAYGVSELLEYARIQQVYSGTNKRSFEQTTSTDILLEDEPTSGSIFENCGVINSAYSLLPLPKIGLEMIGESNNSSGGISEPNERIKIDRQL